MGEPEQLDPLDPERLRMDAESMLAVAHAADLPITDLVMDLLRTCRQTHARMLLLEADDGERYGRWWTEHQAVCDERNDYRERLRSVRRALRDVKLGRP